MRGEAVHWRSEAEQAAISCHAEKEKSNTRWAVFRIKSAETCCDIFSYTIANCYDILYSNNLVRIL